MPAVRWPTARPMTSRRPVPRQATASSCWLRRQRAVTPTKPAKQSGQQRPPVGSTPPARGRSPTIQQRSRQQDAPASHAKTTAPTRRPPQPAPEQGAPASRCSQTTRRAHPCQPHRAARGRQRRFRHWLLHSSQPGRSKQRCSQQQRAGFLGATLTSRSSSAATSAAR
jgi:hypothetical protein